MSDIFEIKGVNAALKISDKEYAFADPKFLEKIMIQKEYKALSLKKESMDELDFAVAMDSLNNKIIKMFLPSIEDEIVSSLGEFAKTALIDKITKLSDIKFGAVVQNAEGK